MCTKKHVAFLITTMPIKTSKRRRKWEIIYNTVMWTIRENHGKKSQVEPHYYARNRKPNIDLQSISSLQLRYPWCPRFWLKALLSSLWSKISHVSPGIDACKRALEAKQKLPIQLFYSWSRAVTVNMPRQAKKYIGVQSPLVMPSKLWKFEWSPFHIVR